MAYVILVYTYVCVCLIKLPKTNHSLQNIFYVAVRECKSSTIHGAPQGSVLGSLQISIYAYLDFRSTLSVCILMQCRSLSVSLASWTSVTLQTCFLSAKHVESCENASIAPWFKTLNLDWVWISEPNEWMNEWMKYPFKNVSSACVSMEIPHCDITSQVSLINTWTTPSQSWGHCGVALFTVNWTATRWTRTVFAGLSYESAHGFTVQCDRGPPGSLSVHWDSHRQHMIMLHSIVFMRVLGSC